MYAIDIIKVTINENYTLAEMTAIVDEARRQHRKVAAHAVDTPSTQTAIDAGVDSVEHRKELTDEQLKQMRDNGMFFDFTPTSYGDFYQDFPGKYCHVFKAAT